MSDTIIHVENLWKEYRLGVINHHTLSRDIQSWWARVRGKEDPNLQIGSTSLSQRRSQPEDRFWALQDVSFEVKRGDILGIIGRNGAGKSTLLKILSQVTTPTKGEVRYKGRIASLLEVGTGFHPELTGRENIFLNGAILGMSKADIRKKLDEIVAFAEIDNFIDTPVKRYSSGMYVRLAFTVAAHLEPEILVVDEVLAVGDIQFQKKCLGKMEDVGKDGRTVLFVSHNMGAIQKLCSRCLLLKAGTLAANGDTVSVTDVYLQEQADSVTIGSERYFAENENCHFQVLSAHLLDEEGNPTANYNCDNIIILEIVCVSRRPVPGLYGCLEILTKDRMPVWVSDTCDIPPNVFDSLPVGMYTVKIILPQRTLGHGEYVINLAFASIQAIQGFHVDIPGEICSFAMHDISTWRGNRRRGVYSTLLKWDIKKQQ